MKKLLSLAAVASLFVASHASAIQYTFDFTNDGLFGTYTNPQLIDDESGSISLSASADPSSAEIQYGLLGLGIYSHFLDNVLIDNSLVSETLTLSFGTSFKFVSASIFVNEDSDTVAINVGANNWTGDPWGLGGLVELGFIGSEISFNAVGNNDFSVMKVVVESVPDTGSSLAFLGLGVLALVGLRRRFAK
ncbi:VPDSG-CTERM sorting domain-containing protein [Pelagicoccus enzymogenes]|uniref:VPDSG-CTERM sorting domain-containing protein n=1 Tax=Pelagicoccus enzymogenes TaxID=2773457 RepID=UPI00280EE50D|nr:VPDSG-CTERM sorting domain-containing protein [Pelagicoccus enzymogenes]MDQ8198828.1 VPDSG-CTERM sorting domain-containing protein [Pelagicoccus enzymogenes]